MLQPLDIPDEMNSDEMQRLGTHATLRRSIVLFGGQGSPSIFSSSAASTAEKDSRSSPSGTILLSRCHAAFLEEIESLDTVSLNTLAIDIALFATPNDLLRPPPEYHRHAVLQATTIYLCQLLRYLAETQRADESFESSFDELIETSGFSSGVLPATVVAHSRTLNEFVASGTEGFRLAFWVACRTFFWSLKASLNRPVDSEATCSLVIRGLSQQQVEDRLQLFATQESSLCGTENNDPPHPTQELPRRLHVSAVSSSNVISISGPRADLVAFKAQLGSDDVVTRFAHVHAWYHGGDQLECVVDEVMRDTQRRSICFPTFSSPAKPIRSTSDGMLFKASEEKASELLPWLVRHLLVHCVHWTKTAQGMAERVTQLLKRQDVGVVRLLSFGPGSDFLFPTFEPPDPRIEFKDLSPFNVSRNVGLSPEDKNSIAIVGMSVHLPKGKGVKELWETLSQGLNAVQEIPESRFKLSDYYSEDSDKPRTMQTRHGAFLDDPFSFDNSFFNISPREAKSMDPQQRILLHAAQEALEDAGYVADESPSFQRSSTGCYVGLSTGDYTDNLRNDIDVFYSPGTLRAFHSGRISYVYNLSGPSIVTDTACSSSIVSIYQACRALQNGDCTTAIAGGANVITSPDMYLGLARGHFLNSTGGCKPFDGAADGYCRAEGCVLFVLKRLSDAVAENDRIHGVIRDVVINQSGNAHSITHPHSETQIDLFQQLLKKSNVDPTSISVIEAHGTGTQAGDAREIESLKAVFGHHHSVANPLVVSSIKGNIGHCEAASGAAGLAKLLLMLRERQIPVQVGFNTVNPRLTGLQNTGLIIPRENMAWNHSQNTPRRAMLNNFGAAGSNTALLLEDWPTRPNPKHQDRSSYVFTLSAKSRIALQKSIDRHLRFLEETESLPALKDICYTATARRQIYEYRVSMACTSVDDLRTKLEKTNAANSSLTLKSSAVVFVFSGQGGLYHGMGEELMHSSPLFKKVITNCDNIIKALGFPTFLGVLSKNQSEKTALDLTDQIITTQCACVALEIALAKLVMSWGITPNYVIGHSLGEYAALCISGALTTKDTLRVVASRAKLIAANCVADATGMLACKLSPEMAERLISEEPRMSQLMVVCLNAVGDCVVGGPLDEMDLFQEECRSRKVKSKILDIPYAFHSPAMDPILEPLRDLGKSIRFRQPTIPVFSNVFGRLFDEDDFSSDYFALHARQPVRFTDSVLFLESKEQMDGTVFLEIGPQPTTLPMLRSSISSSSCSYLSLLQKGQNAWTSISSTLVQISLLGYSLNWRELFAGSFANVISLPGHPLEGPAYTIPFQEGARSIDSQGQHSFDLRSKTEFSLLPWLITSQSSKDEWVFTTTVAVLGPLISGHNVGGTAICPASVFQELVLEGAQTVFQPQKDEVLVVTGISFANPLIYQPSQEADVVSVYITKHDSSHLSDFKIISSGSKNSGGSLHCTGNVSVQTMKVLSSRWIRDTATVARQNDYFSSLGKHHISTFQTRILYEAVFTRVVRYSSAYQCLSSLSVAVSNLEGTGSFRLPPGSQTNDFLAPPVFTDTLLHAAGFIANLAVRSDEVCICSRVDSVEILYSDIDYADCFTVSCSLLDIKSAILADAIALNSSGKVVAVVRGMEFKRLRLTAFQQRLSLHSSPTEPQSPLMEQGNVQLYSPPPTPPMTSNGRSNPVKSGGIIEDVKTALKAILVEVSGFSEQDMDYTKSLDELGIDSLMQIEIISKLARRFPNKNGLDQNTLSECETLHSLESTLVSILEFSETTGSVTPGSTSSEDLSRSTAAASPPVSFQNPVMLHIAEGGATPLCLFHDGSGQVSMYARLSDYDRSTYGFLDPHFGSALRPYKNLNQMTEYYLSSPFVHKLSSLIVGGWSFGGIMAFEAAQQLMAKGIDVKGLILIDSPSPINHEALPNEVIAKIIQSGSAKQNHALDSNVALREEFQHNASLLKTYKPVPVSEENRSRFKVVMLRSQDTFDTENLCGVRYDWLTSQETRDAAIVSWEKLVGGHVEVFPIPGNHFEAFSPKNISETRAQLLKACLYIEGTR